MSLHRIHNESNEVYFCTITCYKWLPLIEEANAYNAVYRWFEHLKKDGCQVVGYVIMPNHFHVLLYPTHTGTSINKRVGECKRFMAYDIVQSLKTKTRLNCCNNLPRVFNLKRSAKENFLRCFACHLIHASV